METIYADTFPICHFKKENGITKLKQLIGTCFFINESGIFMTAKHVIEDALAICENEGGFFGICGLFSTKPLHTIAIPIQNYNFANEPYDVAIGKVDYTCKSTYSFNYSILNHNQVDFWLEVATCGFPVSAVSFISNTEDWHNKEVLTRMRAHRGYIQRKIKALDDPYSSQPDSFELSFLVSLGLSGSPLFVYKNPKSIVIGICVRSVKHSFPREEEVIEEYGVAHDIRPLASWKPPCLGGKSLCEVSC